MIDNVVKKYPRSRKSRRHFARSTRRTGIAGARSPGSTARPTSRRPANSMFRIVWAAATASRRAFSMGCSTGNAEESVRIGWAHGALLTTFPGDTTMGTLDQVRAFAKGGSARIQR